MRFGTNETTRLKGGCFTLKGGGGAGSGMLFLVQFPWRKA